jgi:hypothetical protein
MVSHEARRTPRPRLAGRRGFWQRTYRAAALSRFLHLQRLRDALQVAPQPPALLPPHLLQHALRQRHALGLAGSAGCRACRNGDVRGRVFWTEQTSASQERLLPAELQCRGPSSLGLGNPAVRGGGIPASPAPCSLSLPLPLQFLQVADLPQPLLTLRLGGGLGPLVVALPRGLVVVVGAGGVVLVRNLRPETGHRCPFWSIPPVPRGPLRGCLVSRRLPAAGRGAGSGTRRRPGPGAATAASGAGTQCGRRCHHGCRRDASIINSELRSATWRWEASSELRAWPARGTWSLRGGHQQPLACPTAASSSS